MKMISVVELSAALGSHSLCLHVPGWAGRFELISQRGCGYQRLCWSSVLLHLRRQRRVLHTTPGLDISQLLFDLLSPWRWGSGRDCLPWLSVQDNRKLELGLGSSSVPFSSARVPNSLSDPGGCSARLGSINARVPSSGGCQAGPPHPGVPQEPWLCQPSPTAAACAKGCAKACARRRRVLTPLIRSAAPGELEVDAGGSTGGWHGGVI